MNSFLIYKYNDMASLFVRGMELTAKNSYFPLFQEHKFISNIDPLNGIINALFFYLFEPIIAANLISIFYTALAIYIGYLLFKSLESTSTEKILPGLFAFLYAFSIYYQYRVISFTPNLMQIFIFPGLVYLMWAKKLKTWKLSLLIFFTFALSSYYGFFALIMCGVLLILEEIFEDTSYKQKIYNSSKKLTILILPLLIGIGIFFFSSLVQNLRPVTSKLNENNTATKVSYRPIEEYYNLSFRPWYFFIPPKNSLFFGEFSKEIHTKIKDTNYYLADDYTEEEAAGSFMGWHFILGLILVGAIMVANKTTYKSKIQKLFPITNKNIGTISKALILLFTILLISHPPSFTISGITFYTPSYILYFIAPVFRSLVRLSTIIYLCVLIINYFLVIDLYKLNRSIMYKVICIVTFLTVNFIMFSIRIPLVNYSNPPQEIKFLEKLQNSKGQQTIVVYPKADYYSIFWVTKHKNKLLNPVDYGTTSDNNSKTITAKLKTPEGITEVKALGATQLVFYKDKETEDAAEIDKLFEASFGEIIFSNEYVTIYESRGADAKPHDII